MQNKSQRLSCIPPPSSIWSVGGMRLKRTSRTTLEEKWNHCQKETCSGIKGELLDDKGGVGGLIIWTRNDHLSIVFQKFQYRWLSFRLSRGVGKEKSIYWLPRARNWTRCFIYTCSQHHVASSLLCQLYIDEVTQAETWANSAAQGQSVSSVHARTVPARFTLYSQCLTQCLALQGVGRVGAPWLFFFIIIYLFIYLLFFGCAGSSFLCEGFFSSCGEWGPLFIAVRGPLTIVAFLVAEHRLQTRRLSRCGSRAPWLRGMWDLPGPGLEPVSPALVGRFSTTAPPGKPPLTLESVSPSFQC